MDTAELPETLAVVNGVPIRRGEVAAELAPQLAPLDSTRDGVRIRNIIRQATDEAICRKLLESELEKYGIVPSRAAADAYLAGLRSLMPSSSRGKFESEIAPRLDDPAFQLKAAVHLYLERRFSPELLTVSYAEIGRYYELNRLRYRLPEHWDIGVIRIDRKRHPDAGEMAAAVRARLLQGEVFERVAKEVDPEGAGGRMPTGEVRELFARELAAMAPGDVSNVVPTSDAYYVMLLRDRQTGGVMPLDEVAPFIVMEISAAKDALALRKVLSEALTAANVTYAPFPVSDAGGAEVVPHSPGM
jgi:hypothetical protein